MRQGKDYIIFPLDVPSLQEAREYVDLLTGEVGMFKVGLELFIDSGPEVIRMIRSAGGSGIFLDLKLHDIPATVFRAMGRVADLNVNLATVHCGETSKMLTAAVEGAAGKVGVLGVTVLTSVSEADLRATGWIQPNGEGISHLVLQRAAMAKRSGCRGVVCSPMEAAVIKKQLGNRFLTVTPGIRMIAERVSHDDQKRVMTPGRAIGNGADYLVVGRPIRDAADPAQAARRIAAEVEAALGGSPRSG